MGIVIAIAWYAVKATGGMSSMIGQIEALRAKNGGADPLGFFPDFSQGFASETLWTLPVLLFACTSAYSGGRSGIRSGTGRRRIHRAAHLQRARRASGFALGALVQRGALRAAAVAVDSHRSRGHRSLSRPRASGNQLHDDGQRPCAARAARHHRRRIPRGFHVHDRDAIELGHFVCRRGFYRRFLVRHASERHYVRASQVVTVLLVIASGYGSAQLASIRSGWQAVLEVGAGTGSVYLLRWYWWRINAWSEILR